MQGRPLCPALPRQAAGSFFLTRQEKYVKLEKSISEERRYSRMMYSMVMLMCNTVFGAF